MYLFDYIKRRKKQREKYNEMIDCLGLNQSNYNLFDFKEKLTHLHNLSKTIEQKLKFYH